MTITGASFYSNKAGITGGALRVQVCSMSQGRRAAASVGQSPPLTGRPTLPPFGPLLTCLALLSATT